MSFRSTTNATQFTNRGFGVMVGRQQIKTGFVFDSTKAEVADAEIAAWLKSAESRVSLRPLNLDPYWGFDDLRDLRGEEARDNGS